jgi:DnaJ-class molecular chaperone
MVNYYEILGVNSTASQKDIKMSFKNLVANNSNEGTTESPEIMKKLNDVSKAYSVLGDVEKRKRYDNYLLQQKTNIVPQIFNTNNDTNIFSKYIDKHMEMMKHSLSSIMQEMNHNFESKNSFIPTSNNKYSKVFKSSTYIDNKGQKKTQTIKEVNKNGSIYKEVIDIDGNKKTINRYYPNGKVKTYNNILKNKPINL